MLWPLSRPAFLARLDLPRLEAAIRKTEAGTSAELRVSIAGFFWGSPERLATRAFARLGMHRTVERNGVLLFVAPGRRRLIIRADDEAVRRVATSDAGAWQRIAERCAKDLGEGRATEALEEAISALGALLRGFFPGGPGDANQLPNSVETSG